MYIYIYGLDQRHNEIRKQQEKQIKDELVGLFTRSLLEGL